MLDSPTEHQLSTLHLGAMLNTWRQQQSDAQYSALSFDERFALLVEAEWTRRENQRLQRLLREAKLKLPNACIEDIDFSSQRELDRAQVRQLATCRWVREHHNVLLTGPAGTGKTYLACALAQQACRQGMRALYRRLPRLFHELTLAHADGTYGSLLARFARTDVLILDDFGLATLQEHERRDLLEILDDRYGMRSTIVSSQLPTKAWHTQIGDETVADSICDRLLHNAHRVVLQGASRRKEQAHQSPSDSTSLRSDSLSDS